MFFTGCFLIVLANFHLSSVYRDAAGFVVSTTEILPLSPQIQSKLQTQTILSHPIQVFFEEDNGGYIAFRNHLTF